MHANPHATPKPSVGAERKEAAFEELVTVQATVEHTASVIWLHGLGDTGHTWSTIPSWLQIPWCRFIFPSAPSRQVTTKAGYSMPSWFDFTSLDIHNINEDAASLQHSVACLDGLVQREIDAGVLPERIVLAGFAQGGVVSLAAAIQCRHRLGGLLALSSWLPRLTAGGGEVSASAREVPMWFYHGNEDKVVDLRLGEDSCERARALGLRAQLKTYEGLGHEFGSQEMADFQSFLLRRI
ncbi:Phospholipase/carboxylesterase/thioesterase, partial [Baffinella frigidus]